jgi:hypothetical protein
VMLFMHTLTSTALLLLLLLLPSWICGGTHCYRHWRKHSRLRWGGGRMLPHANPHQGSVVCCRCCCCRRCRSAAGAAAASLLALLLLRCCRAAAPLLPRCCSAAAAAAAQLAIWDGGCQIRMLQLRECTPITVCQRRLQGSALALHTATAAAAAAAGPEPCCVSACLLLDRTGYTAASAA